MKIEQIDPDNLKFLTKNPKLHPDSQIKKIIRSFEEFGFTNPVLYIEHEGEKLIIAGHGRAQAAKEKGLRKVPAIKLDIPYEKAIAYNIADNKLAESEWDDANLVTLFDEIEMSGMDIELTGFDFEEVNDIRLLLEDEAQVIEPPTPPLPDKPKTKKGDLFQLGNHRLLCGDATSKKDVKRLLGKDVKADILLTDPPYGIDIVNNGTIGGKRPPLKLKGAQNYDEQIKAGKYQSVKGDNKPFDPTHLLGLTPKVLIFGGNNFTDKLPVGHHWLVWDKKCGIAGDKNKFSDVELIWTNIDRKSVKIYRVLWSGILREGKRDIELAKRVHPTQKPVKLYHDILRDYSKEGDIILDLYGGSGSLMMACEQLNRDCYMMEIDEAYCDVIIKRYEDLTGKKARKVKG